MNIYIITNLLNNKQYVGREKHYNPNYYGSGKLITGAIKEFGKQNFSREILIDNINDWKECSELEASCKLSFNTIIPNGYNVTCWEYPIPMKICREAAKKANETNKKNKTGFCYDSKLQSKGGRKSYELKLGFHDPKYFGKGVKRAKGLGVGFYDPEVGRKGGKIGGKIVGKQNKELKRGIFAPEYDKSKGAKKCKELGIGIFDLSNKEKVREGASKAGKKTKELKRGWFAPGMSAKGGKLSAYALFELDGLLQQTTLGQLLKL